MPETPPKGMQAPAAIERSPFSGTEVHRQMRQAVPNAPATAVAVPKLPDLLQTNPKWLADVPTEARPLTHDALQRALQEKARADRATSEAAAREREAKEAERKTQTPDKKTGDLKTDEKAVAAVAPTGDESKTPAPTDPALPAPPSAMFNGSFTQSIPIEVPAFRGYEPKLRLVYDSNHGLRAGGLNAGWVGHGWHLEGASEIVRIAPRRGAPRFDATDTWMIDGEEMVACGAGVESPSCGYGGTHATRVESYRRYTYDTGANQWVVTDRDGTQRFYLPVASFPAVSQNLAQHAVYYRYVLHRIVDPNGNTVTFGYTCQTRPACWPTRIDYGPHTILLHSETRPDPVEMAIGGDMMRFDRRLKTIDIVSYGARARAYKLGYDQSPATGASRLVSVQQFGKDATIDGANTITGGTALPPHTFQYQGNAVVPNTSDPAMRIALSTLSPLTETGVLHPDFDGDGKADAFAPQPRSDAGDNNPNCHDSTTGKSNGSTYTNIKVNIINCIDMQRYRTFKTGNFFGDGKQYVIRAIGTVESFGIGDGGNI
ncbi:MAG: hypothetical protein JNK19_04055, partial [Tabrizicola sp.]|nr:hypothetical protein [Tabrizicola sp.]